MLVSGRVFYYCDVFATFLLKHQKKSLREIDNENTFSLTPSSHSSMVQRKMAIDLKGNDPIGDTPWKFNSSPLKNGGWKTSLSYWVSVTFQGRTVKLRGCTPIFDWNPWIDGRKCKPPANGLSKFRPRKVRPRKVRSLTLKRCSSFRKASG